MPDAPQQLEWFDPETQTGLQYVSSHVVQQTGREIVVTFSLFQYPPKGNKVVAQIILNPVHAQELVLTLQSKIDELKNQGSGPPNPRLPPAE